MTATGIEISRAELLRLLDLPADSKMDDTELIAEAHARAEKLSQVQKVRAAEAAARAQDHQLVMAAVADGRLPATRVQFWTNALASDRPRNRAALASLAPGLRPDGTVAASAGSAPIRDHAVENTHREVLRRLGVRVPERVEAAAEPTTYEKGVREHTRRVADEQRNARTDDLGLPIPNFPAPVVITRGKPQSEWTQQERDDALQRKLGQRFWPGTKPAPGSSMMYQPGPGDHSEFDPETGQWREKPRQTRVVE